MARFKVGYQIHPQQCTVEQMLEAACRIDALGADTIWVWDHFFPLYGDPNGPSYECYVVLGAIARETKNAHLGAMVAGNIYRNPDLLAYMTATLDHLSHGRAILGVGAGWNERDHKEFGFEFGDAPWRLREFKAALPRIRARLEASQPPTPHRVPIMIGGSGEKVTLRLVAQYADQWNGFPPTSNWKHKSQVLDEWCEKVGRDPKEIERTVNIKPDQLDQAEDLVAAGCQHLILEGGAPFDMAPLEQLLRLAGR